MVITTIVSGLILDRLIHVGQDWLIKKGFDKVFDLVGKSLDKESLNEFEVEMNNCIQQSNSEYLLNYPQYSNMAGTLFFNSMTFWKEIIDSNLSTEIDNEALMQLVNSDVQIVPCTLKEIEDYLLFLNKNIKGNQKLGKLNIEYNYKRNI
ncbi:MAG: hypothetical protein IPK62_02085 [Bacteroidetes bacterium]|nr:hypothetical protein [Bacteroidota bacterium]